MTIETAPLKLVPLPLPLALARAEIGDRGEFGRLLGASVPDNWPPGILSRRASGSFSSGERKDTQD